MKRVAHGPLITHSAKHPTSLAAPMLVASLLLAGCNNAYPPREGARDGTSTTTASPAGSVGAAGSAPRANALAPGGCASDADCRTWSSYCQDAPCGCRVFSKSESEPACASGQVTCFADPCMRKKAACQGGRCALVLAEADSFAK